MMHEVWVAKIMISVSIQKKLASTCFPRKRPLVWEVLKPWLSILQLARHPGIVARLGGRVEAAGCCLPQVSDMPWYGNSKENSHLVCVCVCVCVWNFSREVKLVPELPWHYFGSILTYSVELLSHLVFRMSIRFLFLCLLKKNLHIAMQS